ncbi:MAG: hypothetical protein AB7E98_11990 [Pirellulales bacterium]
MRWLNWIPWQALVSVLWIAVSSGVVVWCLVAFANGVTGAELVRSHPSQPHTAQAKPPHKPRPLSIPGYVAAPGVRVWWGYPGPPAVTVGRGWRYCYPPPRPYRYRPYYYHPY